MAFLTESHFFLSLIFNTFKKQKHEYMKRPLKKYYTQENECNLGVLYGKIYKIVII
jgi:hypothetical protein